jgi:ferredoxin
MKYTIKLVDTGEDFFCREDQHLLQGMQNYQIGKAMLDTIPVGCRGGGCGICRIRILSGQFESKKMSCKHITGEDHERGIALACRIYPRSELSIAVLDPSSPEQLCAATLGAMTNE